MSDWSDTTGTAASLSAISFDALKAALDREAKSEDAAIAAAAEEAFKEQKEKNDDEEEEKKRGTGTGPKSRSRQSQSGGKMKHVRKSAIARKKKSDAVVNSRKPLSLPPPSPMALVPAAAQPPPQAQPRRSRKKDVMIIKRDWQGFRLCERSGCMNRVQKQEWVELQRCSQCIGIRFCNWVGCTNTVAPGEIWCVNCLRTTAEEGVIAVNRFAPAPAAGVGYHTNELRAPGRLVIGLTRAKEEDKDAAVDKTACGGLDLERNSLIKELRWRAKANGKRDASSRQE